MIQRCVPADFDDIVDVINAAAEAYRGVIPADCWRVPYMPADELRAEIAAGVEFSGSYIAGRLTAVMGLQQVGDVTLIRHAYTRTTSRGQGLGSALLRHLLERTERPVLVGTWRAATWAIAFYEHHGFQVVPDVEKEELLRRYWTVHERQIAESVVLADGRWRGPPVFPSRAI